VSAPDLVPPGTVGGGTPIGGSGTTGTLAKFTAGTTIGDSVVTELSGKIGIGTTSPQTTVDTTGIITSRSAVSSTPLSPTEGIRFSLSGQLDVYDTTVYRNSIFNSVASAASNASMQFRLSNNASTQATILTLKGDGLVGIGTTSPSAALDLPASTAARASLRIQTGAAPTAPNNGDIWFDGTNIFMRVGGVTKTFTLI